MPGTYVHVLDAIQQKPIIWPLIHNKGLIKEHYYHVRFVVLTLQIT